MPNRGVGICGSLPDGKVNSAQTTEELKKMYAELLKENSMLRTQLEQLLPSAIYVKTDKEKSK